MFVERLNYEKIAPAAIDALLGVENYVLQSGLEASLIDLVKLRVSQINGCAFCMDMHSKAARQDGETEQRLYVLNGWREAALYTPRERAALAWTEALTLLPESQAPDSDYEPLGAHFSDKEIVDLTVLIAQINTWNRLAVGLRRQLPDGEGGG